MNDVKALIRGTIERGKKRKAATKRKTRPRKAEGGGMSADDQAAMMPETYANPLVKQTLGDLAALPQRAIDASAQDVQHLGEPDYQRQAIGPAVDTALTMVGGAGAMPAEASALRSGLGMNFRKASREALEKFSEDSLRERTNFFKEAAEAKKPIDPLRDARVAGGYSQPAYRGMQLWDKGPAKPVYDGAELYSTESPMLADMYASNLTKHPGWSPPESSFGEGATVSPLWIDTSKYLHADAKGAVWSSFNWKAISKAKEEGKHGVVIDNVWDEPGSTQSLPSPKRIFITFPEGASTVKSKFATRFDKESPNMMHGIGAIGLGGPAGGYVSMMPMDNNKSTGGSVGFAEGGAPDGQWPGQAIPTTSAAQWPGQPFNAQAEQPMSWSDQGADIAKSGATGVGKGMINFAGTPGDAANLLTKGSKAAGDYIGGMFGAEPSPEPTGPLLPTSGGIQKGIESKTGEFYKPKTTAGKYADTIGQFAGNPISYAGPGSMLAKAGLATIAGAGSEAAGQAFAGTGLEGPARVAGSLAGAPLAAFGRRAAGEIPSTEQLFDSATGHYSNMKGFGVEIHPRPVGGVAKHIRNELDAEGYEDFIAPKTFKSIDKLEKAASGNTVTVSQLDNVRKTLGKAAGDPAERDAARRAIGHIDDYLSNLDPADVVVNPHFAQRVGQEAQMARGDYAAAKRSEALETASTKAERQAASTGSGANIDNATRQQVKAILNNPKKLRGFSDAEQAQMEQIVRGTFTGNASRLLGKLAPTGVVSGGLSAALGHIVGHTIGVPALGAASKMAADAATKRAAERLSEAVRSRSPLARSMPTPRPRLSGRGQAVTGMIPALSQNPFGGTGNPFAP